MDLRKMTLTRKTAVDQAYMPLFQFCLGELYTGAFQTGTIVKEISIEFIFGD